jgi:hypothetical protein
MLVVVGGHSSKIGKTSVAAGLIRRLRGFNWTALKITQSGGHACARESGACGCEPEPGQPFTLSEEYEPGDSDSGRFLAAGAERSFWLRTSAGELGRAAGILQKLLKQSENVMVESTSVAELVKPDAFLMVLDFSCDDFTPSSIRFFDRADAFVLLDHGINAPLWDEVARGKWDAKPRFLVKPPRYVTPAMVEFVQSRQWGGQFCPQPPSGGSSG